MRSNITKQDLLEIGKSGNNWVWEKYVANYVSEHGELLVNDSVVPKKVKKILVNQETHERQDN